MPSNSMSSLRHHRMSSADHLQLRHFSCPVGVPWLKPKPCAWGQRDCLPKRVVEVPVPQALCQVEMRGLVGNYSLDNMAVSWDDSPAIRDRIRENHNLMMRYDDTLRKPVGDGYIDATIDNIKLNAMVLTPLLVVMKDNNLQLPSIEALNKSIEAFYQLSKVARSADLVYQESWALRRLIGRVKKFIYRPFPPQDCCDLKTKNISTI